MNKHILTILLLLCSISLFAETEMGSRKEERRARRDSIKLAEKIGAHAYRGTIKLDDIILDNDQRSLLLSNIDAVDFNADWQKYNSRRKWGNGLVIGGSCLMGGGAVVGVAGMGYALVGILVTALTLGYGDTDDIFNTAATLMLGGVVGMAAGGVALGVGIPIKAKAKKNMKRICNGYNNAVEKVDKELIFGSTPSGVGLSFRF